MSELPFWAAQEHRARDAEAKLRDMSEQLALALRRMHDAEEKYRVLRRAVRHYFDADSREDNSEWCQAGERLQDLVDWDPPGYEAERETEYEQAMEDAERGEINRRLTAREDGE